MLAPLALHVSLPADLAQDVSALAAAEGRTITDEVLVLLRRAVAGRQLRELLARAGSDLEDDAAMEIALEEERAARRGR